MYAGWSLDEISGYRINIWDRKWMHSDSYGFHIIFSDVRFLFLSVFILVFQRCLWICLGLSMHTTVNNEEWWSSSRKVCVCVSSITLKVVFIFCLIWFGFVFCFIFYVRFSRYFVIYLFVCLFLLVWFYECVFVCGFWFVFGILFLEREN